MQTIFALVKKQVGFALPSKASPLSQHLYTLLRGSDLTAAFPSARSSLRATRYVNISLFDKKQITAYLKKHNNEIVEASQKHLNARTLFDRIQEIYDLEDLAQRPILLKLIVKTLPSFQRTVNGTYEVRIGGATQIVPDITPSALYDVYTQRELAREYDEKGVARSLVDRQAKVRIIAAVAFQMFRSDELTLERVELTKIVKQIISSDEDEERFFSADIATCSFLTRDSHGALRFTHKSFVEYYAAVSIRLGMATVQSIQELLSLKPFNDEIALFLGDSISVAADADAITGRLVELYDRLSKVASPSDTCIQNILNVLNYARTPVSPLSRVRVGTLVYRKMELHEQSSEDLHIDVLRTIKLQAYKWHIVDSEVKRWEAQSTRIEKLTAKSTEIKGVRFWDTTINECQFFGGGLQIETWRNSNIHTAIFAGTVIVNSGSVGARWLPAQGEFENCILVGLDFRSQAFCDSQFKKCTFIKCYAGRSPHKEMSIQECQGVLLTDGQAGIRDWGYGLSCCSLEDARALQKKDVGESPTWQQLLLSCFDTEIARLPKNFADLSAKLHQVNLAMELNRHIGKVAIIVGGMTSNSECRIVSCNAYRVTLLDLKASRTFTHPLSKTAIEEIEPIRIRLERN